MTLSRDESSPSAIYSETPLVSVGIPTYNRASLLDSRLLNVTSQTYRNIEIILSDNASSDVDVLSVIERWRCKDSRIISYRQSYNIGSYANFLYVLSKSSGPLFIWAADDDEWDLDFLTECVTQIGQSQLIMPRMAIKYIQSGQVDRIDYPSLSPNLSRYNNCANYLRNPQPSLIYGLHRKEFLEKIIPLEAFDLADSLTVYLCVLNGGIVTGGLTEYRAGVPNATYEIKPFGRTDSRHKLSYRRYIVISIRETFRCHKLSYLERIKLIAILIASITRTAVHLSNAYPDVAQPSHLALSRLIGFKRSLISWASRIIRRR